MICCHMFQAVVTNQNTSKLLKPDTRLCSTGVAFIKQEYIPVGCVPAARSRPYAGVCFPGGGVCLVQGGSAWSRGDLPGPRGSAWSRGVCLVLGGVCLVLGGGSAWSWRGLPGPRGGLPGLGGSTWSWGICLVQGGFHLVPGGLPGPGGLASQHALRQTPSPLWTDTHL